MMRNFQHSWLLRELVQAHACLWYTTPSSCVRWRFTNVGKRHAQHTWNPTLIKTISSTMISYL
ncbi:hypothetical protein M758_1G329200 [Ceratodon purpureus]|uniref:Uncharacterized protein n=1 Tax=Ceratodon purpureus TaxID=3225 RepID=A0A8T0JC93_CERPU|nr:hypothetical protein KC19_1G336700 [Ceratodon purpureus]KAG0632444.1 hypothetical protein M758_1G329200 [Ceratodon purpureus]